MTWRLAIGLEIHVQLATRAKMFCRCETAFGAPPNTQVCPVCLGLPGALPVPNTEAVRLAVRTAVALGCHVREVSRFERKHYFYPDLPKGYQISQYAEPLATGGHLVLSSPSEPLTVGLERVHLEEDAGKSVHDRVPDRAAIDFNRCGVPLLEIVTAPQLRTPEDARRFLTELRRFLTYLDVSDCSMEEGSLRVDANLSLHGPRGREGGKQEIKNLNSFAAVERALHALCHRQAGALERGAAVEPATLGFGTDGLSLLRPKEESEDYRYLPDPDLPPLDLARLGIDIHEEQRCLPELPAIRELRLADQYDLVPALAHQLTSSRELADYFETVVASGASGVVAAEWVRGALLADAHQHGGTLRVPAPTLAALIALVQDGTLTRPAAMTVFRRLAEGATDPHAVAEQEGLVRVGDREALTAWVDVIFAAHPAEVARLRSGERRLTDFFVGRVLAISGGRADPLGVRRIIAERSAREWGQP